MSANAKFHQYTTATDEVAVYPGAGTGDTEEIAYLGLGLAGETGEAVDVLKKMVRDGGFAKSDVRAERIKKLQAEFGDIMWYYCRLMRVFGFKIDDVLDLNINKLMERKAKGQLKVHD